MMPSRSVSSPCHAARAAARLKSLWKTGGPAVFLAMALVVLLLGEIPCAGFRADASDSLLVVGAQAAAIAGCRAVAAPGARLPHGIPDTPFFPGGLPAASVPAGFLLRFPAPDKTNSPTDGEYAFTRTRLRTLSPLCRIACG